MADTKITTAMKLDMIEEIAKGTENEAVILEYCAAERAKLANKKVKAQERAAAKKEAGDELRACIEEILQAATDPMTREDVLAKIEDPDGELTPAKVGNRITQLVQLNKAHKTSVKVEGEDGKSKSKVAYVWGPADAE